MKTSSIQLVLAESTDGDKLYRMVELTQYTGGLEGAWKDYPFFLAGMTGGESIGTQLFDNLSDALTATMKELLADGFRITYLFADNMTI